MKQANIRNYIVQGRSELIGLDGLKHTKVMVRTRGRHGRKQETWIDTDDTSIQIGDDILLRRVRPYQIVQEQEEGETDVRHCSDE